MQSDPVKDLARAYLNTIISPIKSLLIIPSFVSRIYTLVNIFPTNQTTTFYKWLLLIITFHAATYLRQD